MLVSVHCKTVEEKNSFSRYRITLRNENSFGFLLCSCMCSFFLVTQHLDLLIVSVF